MCSNYSLEPIAAINANPKAQSDLDRDLSELLRRILQTVELPSLLDILKVQVHILFEANLDYREIWK